MSDLHAHIDYLDLGDASFVILFLCKMRFDYINNAAQELFDKIKYFCISVLSRNSGFKL